MNTANRLLQLSPNNDLHPHGQHHPTSLYVERYWLPIIGPSSLTILRGIGDLCNRYPNTLGNYIEMQTQQLGLHFGIRSARQFVDKLNRLSFYRLANEVAPDTWFIANRIPNLTPRQIANLPTTLATQHQQNETTDTHTTNELNHLSAH